MKKLVTMKQRWVSILIVGILIFLLAWRLWPHSLKDILPVKEVEFTSISIDVSEFSTSTDSLIDNYSLDIVSPEDKSYDSVISILLSTKFRSDFRNLLPWDILTVDSGGKNITHSAIITLTWGNTNNEVHITFHGDRIVSLDIGGNTGFLVYHPTNKTVLNQLVTYTVQNGMANHD